MIDNENTVVAYDNEENEKKSGMSDTARKVAIGGGIGILLGASAAAVAQTMAPKPEPIKDEEIENNDDVAGDTVEISGKVNDGMSFSEAFAAARAEVGPGGMFTWHGNSYSTFTADEWDGMSAAERAEYSRLIAPHVQHHDVAHHTTVVHDAPETVIEQQTIIINEKEEVEEPELDLTRVRIISGEEVELEDGNTTIIGKGFVDGHDAEFHDLSRSGQFDTAVVDVNDNGTFADENSFDISDQHLSVNNIEEEEVAQNDDDFVYVEDSPLLPLL